jgi:hypothetical protein
MFCDRYGRSKRFKYLLFAYHKPAAFSIFQLAELHDDPSKSGTPKHIKIEAPCSPDKSGQGRHKMFRFMQVAETIF